MLLFLLCGVIDFGRLLNIQLTLSAAAREGARWAALGQGDPAGRALAAAITVNPAPGVEVLQACAEDPAVGAEAEIEVSGPYELITPLAALSGLLGGDMPGQVTLTGRGTMRCGG